MLNSVLDLSTTGTTTISLQGMLLCTAASLIMGLLSACIYMYKNTYSRNFVMTLVLLPAMVQIVIMLVNGNLGAGVAVMGAFSLVRFRSVPGSAREISHIFLAMAIGLATGMGYVGYAAIFLLIVGAADLVLMSVPFAEGKKEEKELKITIPENLDYTGIFDDLFAAFTDKVELQQVRTTNMGSLYELRYHVMLKNKEKEKEFLDQLRCRNGNLTISCGRIASEHGEVL